MEEDLAHLDYETPVTTLRGEEKTLKDYEGNVLLIVNTASKCGFTPQYKGLEALYQKFKDRGLVVLGFPCNQFGRQEQGSENEIAEFCELNFGVTFPLHSKIDVNGKDAHPLFKQLKSGAPGLLGTEAIKWNFTKFLIGKDGSILERFGSNVEPKEIEQQIEALL